MSVQSTQRPRAGYLLCLIEVSLWATTGAAGLMLGIGQVRESRAASPRAAAAPIPAAPPPVAMIAPESLASAVDIVSDGNVFRRERAPADPGAPVPSGAPPVPQPPQPPKPRPVLRGLLGGPPWQAVLEGLPGRDGNVVLRVGETVGGLTVRAVRHDTVTVQGADTVWKLTIHRP